jgi:hypothetical protein
MAELFKKKTTTVHTLFALEQLARTIAPGRRRGLYVACHGELERAVLVHGDADRRVAAECGAEALRVGLHDAGGVDTVRLMLFRHGDTLHASGPIRV